VTDSLDSVANRDELLHDEWFQDNMELQHRLLSGLLASTEALNLFEHKMAVKLLELCGMDMALQALDLPVMKRRYSSQ
jgi:hypothetical protein